MTDVPLHDGQPDGSDGTSLDVRLSAALELFGFRVDAAADFGPGADTVLSIRPGDITLGALLVFLVDKAEPGRDIKLTPPWDFLNTINLHDFTFEIDLTRFRIGVRYEGIGFSTPFISLTAVELFYSSPTADRSKSVDLSLFGSFLGVDFSKEPGLTWDVLSEPAPSVPGQGAALFDLEYLAIGQHVTLRNIAQLDTIGAVIDALESTGRPTDAQTNPLTQLPALKFDGASGWLFATKFSALQTVTLSAVFNDPVLYGLRVALDGKRVGKLAGLEFEILYRKISDSLGVFHTELKLPDAVRTIEMGEATVTLPIIDVDVYTNGNFLVDLGFPRNLDFSRALSVDFIVFVPIPIPVSAAVGLYFGVLSGETSNQVPQVTNGRFDPVIVAGIGVRVGLGYAISLGPLEADFFAGVVGILEGVLAWFHPDADPHSQAVYLRISGTVGIQIHIAGTVNFAILQASLDIEAYADASAVVESYQPIHLTFEAGVSISLSVKVLFFHITLSFSATIRESITIGSASPTPWVLGAPQPGSATTPAAVGGTPHAVLAAIRRDGITWHDQAALVSPVAPGHLDLAVYVQPMVTAGLAGDRPGGTPGPAQPQLVAVLFVSDTPGSGGSPSPFAELARNAFVWAAESADLSVRLAAVGGTGAEGGGGLPADPVDPAVLDDDTPVPAGHLRALYAELADPTRPFPVSRVVDFLTARNITLALQPIPSPPPDPPPSYTVFPMPPFLAMTVGDTTVDFGTGPYHAGPNYQSFVTRYFQELSAGVPRSDPERADAADATPPDSVAGVLFADYFAFLLRQLVQDAIDLYRTWSAAAAATDTLDAIADRFGISDPELVTLNLDVAGLLVADQVVTFATGDTAMTRPDDTLRDLADRSDHAPADVAVALGAQPGVLAPGAVLALPGGRTHTVVAGDTLLSIAAGQAPVVVDDAAVVRIGRANQASTAFFPTGRVLIVNRMSTPILGGETLRSLAARLQSTPLLVARAVRDRTGVLQVGAALQVAGARCTVAAGENLDAIATRLATTTDAVVGAAADVPRLLRPLAVLALPAGAYTVGPGDTLGGIAARTGLTLAEVGQAAAAAPDLLVAGVTFALPTTPYPVAPATGTTGAESLGAIVDRFGTTLADLVAANADAPALLAGATMSFGLTTQVRTGESLRQLAGRFGLGAQPADLVRALDDVPGLLTPGALLAAAAPGTYTFLYGDTLASVAAAFATTPQAIVAANPTVDCAEGHPCWYPPPVGLTIALPPGLTWTVQPNDTPAAIARRFGLSAVDLVLGPQDPAGSGDPGGAANLDNADLLVPQTAIQLPDVTHVVAKGETPLGIAQDYGLSVDQLVLANRGAGFGTVVVPDVQVLPLSALVGELAAAGRFEAPAGALARFLLHGLRLPSPDDVSAAIPADLAALPLYPLYTLTGQQVTPPAAPPDGYAVVLRAGTADPRPAITFAGDGCVKVPLSGADSAALDAIRGQLAQQPPIDAVPLAETPYPAVAVAPRQYALGRPIPWQAASPPTLVHDTGTGAPAPAQATNGSPALYPFPDALRAQVAASAGAGPGLLVDLVTGTTATPTSPVDPRPVTGFGWATRIEFGVRRVPDLAHPGQFRPTVFEVFGTDPAATDDLATLLAYLGGPGTGAAVTLALLYPAGALAGAGPGLRSDPDAATEVLLLKANLSTQSHPPGADMAAAAAAAADPPPPLAAATMTSEARGFLTLLWEAAVTNTGGYFLLYSTAGAGLPPEIFNQDPTATVSLLATVFPTADPHATAALQPFHNAAAVVEALPDPTAAVLAVPRRYPTVPTAPTTLQAVAADLGVSVDELAAANVETRNLLAPGTTITVGAASRTVVPGDTLGGVARALGTDVPSVAAAIAGDASALTPGATLEVYAAWLTHGSTLRPGAAGFRVVRADPDPATTGQDDAKTKLEVLFNLIGYRLTGDAGTGFAASPDGLPIGPTQSTGGPLNHALTAVAGTDPWAYQKQVRVDRYAREGAATLGTLQDPYAGVGTQARFGWQYQDVFGNRLLDPRMIDVDVRYTDELIGVSQWPAILTGYRFTDPPKPVSLAVSLDLDTSVYVAAPGEVFAPVGSVSTAGLAARAATHRDRYAQIFWQLSHDLAAEVTTTVDGATPHEVSAQDVAGFAAAARTYLQGVATLTQATVVTRDGDTLASLAAAHHVTPAELATANRSVAQNAAAADLLSSPEPGPVRSVVVEARYSVLRTDMLAQAVAQAPPSVSTDAGQVAAANPDVALQAGLLIVVGAVHPVAVAETFAGVAAASGLAPTQLGGANADRGGLLTPGLTLALPGGTAYRIADGDTLASIATRSVVAVADVAAALAAAPDGGPLVAGSALVVPVALTTSARDTPTTLGARFAVTAAELLAANAGVDALLPGGQLTLPGGARYTVHAGDTLAAVATATATAVADLASLNADSPAVFRPGARLTSSYRVQAGDTFATVADRFEVPTAALGTANALVAGLVVAEQALLLGTRTQPVEPGDTFASLAAAAGVPIPALATANATTAGLLTAGVHVALPRHVTVPPTAHPHTVAAGETWAGIAAAARVEVALLGAANADVDGLLAAGATLFYTLPGGRTYQVVTRAQETVSTAVLALQDLLTADGVVLQLTAALVVEANQAAPCLAAGGSMLVPPPTFTVTTPVTATNDQAIFPLETTLTLRRTANVDPALEGNPVVTSVSTPVAPLLPEGVAGRTVALREFAGTFEAAFTAPQLKLTTTGDTAVAGTPRFVAVQFGPGTALDVAVGPGAAGASRFFAPRPLSARPGPDGAYLTSLWSSPGPIPITDYVRGTGSAQQPRSVSFTGVDLDVWGRQFLAQLDLVLSADYAVPTHRLCAAAYTALLAAKQTLAGAIRDSVAQVTAPGTASIDELGAAQDLLHGRLLTTLSEAYLADAIVTVPVVVTAPPAWSGTTAPRVHGQPVGTIAGVPAALRTTAAGDTLASVAAGGSTVWAVGAANANLVGLVAADVTIPLPTGQVYRTVAGDTLASIADQHDLPLAAVVEPAADVVGLLAPHITVTVPTATLRTLAAGFSAPVALLVDLLADASGLLLPGAAVTSARTATVAAGDTLATLAARFRRTAPELGSALGAVPGLLAAGITILTSTGVAYRTRAGDTLAGIAATLAVPVGDLAADAAQVPGLLVPGVATGLPPYTVAVDDTLSSVAAHFPGTTADLGAALADVPGLLEPGAGVPLVVRSYTFAEGDALHAALSALALDVATPDAESSAAADLAAMNADTPDLFIAGTVLTVPEPVVVADGDTAVSLARAHHLTPSEVTARGDELRPGTVLALPDPEIPPYTVGPGDTLESIAAHIGHEVTPAWIVSTVLSTSGIVTAGVVVRYLSRVPGFSLSDATVTLTDGHGAAAPLAFLLHTASNVEFDSLAVDLDFPVNQLEYDISDVPWAAGYQSANWLTFLLPPTAAPIGRVDIPIALRTFPVPPSVVGQQVTAYTARTVVGQADTLQTVAAAVGAAATTAADALLAPGALLELPTEHRARARPGDTAADLAARLGVPADLVVAAACRHGVLDRAGAPHQVRLPTGAIVPVPGVHTVADGESLAAVAARHGVPVDHLLARNAARAGLLQPGTTVTATASPTLQELRRYDYDVTFNVRRAAQDSVSTGYVQNVPPDPATTAAGALAAAGPAGAGLGGWLAQFATVRAELAGDLALIPAVDPLLPTEHEAQAANPAAAAALATFAPLAVQIAGAWVDWVAPPTVAPAPAATTGGAAPPHEVRFALRRGTSPAGGPTVHLLPQGPVAALLADEPIVGLAGHLAADGEARAGRAPVVFTADPTPLVGVDPGTVAPQSTGTAADVDTPTITLLDRDVISTQNIWGQLSLARNTALLPGVPTSSAFVYTVPDARMPAPATPLLTSTTAFAVTDVPFAPPSAPPGPGPADRRPLTDWLINFFDSLLNRYAVLATETLRVIATRFGLGLADLTPAVADLGGLLIDGTRLTLPGGTYTCASTDTLRGIASTQSVALAAVVDAAADIPGSLVPGTLLRPVATARYLRVSADFAFTVAASADPAPPGEIISRLPVLLRPTALFDSATDLDPTSGFCSDLAGALTAWATGRGVPDDVGMWLLGVALYTTLPATGSPAQAVPDTTPPLLQLDNLRLPRNRVAPPAGGPMPRTPTAEDTP